MKPEDYQRLISNKIEESFANKELAISGPMGTHSRGELWSRLLEMKREWRSYSELSRILITGHRDLETLLAITLCMFQGITFSITDPVSSKKRRSQIIEQFQPQAIFDSRDGLELLESENASYLLLEASYVVFTSGSTGKPKGVVVGPENLWHFANWYLSETKIRKGSVFSVANPFFFDNAIADICCFSMTSATAVLIDDPKNIASVRKSLESVKLTHWFSAPSMIRLLITTKVFSKDVLGDLDWIGFGGEPMYLTEIEKLSKLVKSGCKLVNIYGPSECTCITSMHEITPQEIRSGNLLPLIGKMNKNSTSWLIPSEGDSKQGELVISGSQVARGYLSGEDGGFFLQPDGTLAFRTGDIMESDNNGDLTFVARADRQLKIMGHRVEPSEVENSALENEGLAFAACVGFEQLGTLSLGLVYQGRPKERTLKASLSSQLPSYMLPRKLIRVDSMPLNQNGKIDYSEVRKLLEAKDGV